MSSRTRSLALVVVLLVVVSTFGVLGAGALGAFSSGQGFTVQRHGGGQGVQFLTAPTCNVTVSTENPTHNAIQNEIANYSGVPGAVVCLGAGTFAEQISITGTTNFTLWGNGADSTILEPSTVVANTHNPDDSPALPVSALVSAVNATNLTVANLAVNGSLAYGSVAGCDGYFGIYYLNSSGQISGTAALDLNQLNGCQSQSGIVANNGFLTTGHGWAQTLSISANTVLNYGKNGIVCNDVGLSCAISGNTVSTTAMPLGDSATNGIEVAWGSTAIVTGNTVSGNDYLPAACTSGNYFFQPTGGCNGASLYMASGILTYAAGNGVNISSNTLSGNQMNIAVVGNPADVWDNTVLAGSFYGIVFDFNATPGWLGTSVLASGPYVGVAGGNSIANANVGVLVYDENATLLGNTVTASNVSYEAETDLPVAYHISLSGDVGQANLCGALLGDISSYQPGAHAIPESVFTLSGVTFTNDSASAAPGTGAYGALVLGEDASVTGSTFTSFTHGLSIALPASGDATVSASVVTAPTPSAAGSGIYAFAGNASVTGNQVSGFSWMNGPGWWPNSQATGIFTQCLETCDVTGNHVANDAIGIAMISYVYGPFPAPSWPFAAPPSRGPINVSGNTVVDSGAFGVAFELNQQATHAVSTPSVLVSGNTIDDRATGAVGAMFDQGTYSVVGNVFLGSRTNGSSGSSQPTGVGAIGSASVQVLNAYDNVTTVAMNRNAFVESSALVALLNLTPTAGDFANVSFGEPVSFTESGLPGGTTWYTNLTGGPSASSTGPTVLFDLANGSYADSVASADPTYAPIASTSTVTVAGGPVSVAVPFAQVTYTASFVESGLPSGTSWTLYLQETSTLTVRLSTTSSSLAFNLPNGTYSYAIANVPGWHLTTGSYSGSLTVAGGDVATDLTFGQVTYALVFSESGLPSGTSWSATVGVSTLSSTTSTITFQEPNGSYAYSIADVSGWHLSGGSYSGTQGISAAGATVSLTFAQVTYVVLVTESGLPSGTSWGATVDASSQTTTGASLSFAEPNGSYSYSVSDVPGWHLTAGVYAGTVVVSGGNALVALAFGQVVYGISFVETGLAAGLNWSVTFNGTTLNLTTDGGVDTLSFASEPNGSYSYAIADLSGWHETSIAYSGTLTVTGGALSEDVGYTQVTYPVDFSETGLPTGTSWSVTLGSSTLSTTATGLSFSVPNGTYAYSIADVSGWHLSVGSYSGTAVVNGAGASVSMTFSEVTYGVTFSESGLPSGLNWSVVFNGTTLNLTTDGSTDTLTFASVANGSYAYAIADLSGWHEATLPYSGSLAVAGAGLSVALSYTQVLYAVTFSETGLPGGTSWSVTLGATTSSSTSSAIGFNEPNGTLSYSVADVPGWHLSSGSYAGTVNVNGAAVNLPLVFQQVNYSLSFVETGLPSATGWSVTLGATTLSSTTGTIAFTGPNGTYSYSVADVPGWHLTTGSYSGSLTVAGGDVATDLTFGQVTYALVFSESGLPSGTSWSATVGVSTLSSTTSTITFQEPNGSYAYSIADVSGWHLSGGSYSGTQGISAAGATVSLTFAQVTYGVSFSESGLPSGLTWTVTFNGTALSLLTDGGVDTLSFASEPNGTYAYAITDVSGWHEATLPYAGALAVSGGALSEGVTYNQVTYAVTFSESGLPAGQNWSVTFDGTTLNRTTDGGVDTLTFASEPNGTYSYAIADLSGWHQGSMAYAGSLAVSGGALASTLAYTEVTYAVTFSESGLPSGTSWSVTLGATTLSSTTSTIVFEAPNGTVGYTVADVSGWHLSSGHYSGTLTLNGAGTTVSMTFSQVRYLVIFSETGLPAGTSWSVTLGATTITTTSARLSFLVPNGTYAYSIANVAGWHILGSAYHGTVTVSGTFVKVSVRFTQVRYLVTFSETGLPTGTSWKVTIGSTTISSTATSIAFHLPNGTYTFTVSSTGFTATPSTGTFTIAGTGHLFRVKFT